MDDNSLKELKRGEYNRYIVDHISNVADAFEEMKVIFKDCSFINDPEIYRELQSNILIHDRSKFSEAEFEPYRMHFYPINDKEKEESKELFDEAWEHHYKVNRHHWDHWYNKETGECETIPEVYLAELIVDWMAMGRKFGNTPLQYYENNKDKIQLHPQTRIRLEYLLSKFA